MLPASRTEGQEGTLPPFALARSDVEGFLHELRGFHEAFRDCFTRREPREHFFRSMVGQFSPLERKSIELMALVVEGAMSGACNASSAMTSGTQPSCAASTLSWLMTTWVLPMAW
jgi:hypothetical protein